MKNFELVCGVYTRIVSDNLVFLDSNNMKYFQLDRLKTKIILNCFNNLEKTQKHKITNQNILKLLVNNNLIKETNNILVDFRNKENDDKFIKPITSIYSKSFFNRDKLTTQKYILVLILNLFVRIKFKIVKNPLLFDCCKFMNDSGEEKLLKLIGQFNSALVYSPWGGINKCLIKSMALKYYLHFYGFNSDLIIGVKTEPFYAHAWLQLNDYILNDELDYVGDYKQILRIK